MTPDSCASNGLKFPYCLEIMIKTTKISSKMSSPVVLLLLATLLAAGVAVLAYLYLQKREISMQQEIAASSRKRQTPKVQVVVPRIDAAVNTVLNNTTFSARSIDADLVYPDTLLAKDFPALEGQKLARAVLGGRPVRASDLVMPDVNDVAAILPPGMRAVTIDIDNLNSIAQTLRPNHRVDLFLMSKIAPDPAHADKGSEVATLFMQDMIVLATGQEFRDVNSPIEHADKMVRPGEVEGVRDKGFNTVTLLVKPAEAARLLIGQRMGAYRVMLRGTGDRNALALAPLRSVDLLSNGARKRDEGIEFIVGGRAGSVVSRVAVPPSQAAAVAALASYSPEASSPASQPVPVLRGTSN